MDTKDYYPATYRFVELAKLGGWKEGSDFEFRVRGNGQQEVIYFGEQEWAIESIILNLEVWSAVEDAIEMIDKSKNVWDNRAWAQLSLHMFIDDFISGASLEQSLSKLLKPYL